MLPKLVYVLMMMGPDAGYHGAMDLHTSTVQGRCERLQAQLKQVPFNGRTYKCIKMTVPASMAVLYTQK